MTRLRVTLLTFHPVLQSSFVPTTLTTQMITRTEILYLANRGKTAYINRYNTVALIGQAHSNLRKHLQIEKCFQSTQNTMEIAKLQQKLNK